MTEIHKSLLDILRWFHTQCVEHGYRYYIIGGTMLGAVRHHGFIPWDDDIDVAMPREDYISFCKEMKESKDRYVVESPQDDNLDYTYLSAKIYDRSTTLIESKRKPIKRGLYVDVFPLDGIGNTKEEAFRNYRKINNLIHLYDTVTCAYRKSRAWYKNVSIFLGRIASSVILKERRLNSLINKECCKRDFDTCEYVGNLVGAWGYKEIMNRAFFGKPTEYTFEDMIVWGPEDADSYLSSLYGDYMKLPPKHKQVSHHDYLECNLKKSYLE